MKLNDVIENKEVFYEEIVAAVKRTLNAAVRKGVRRNGNGNSISIT